MPVVKSLLVFVGFLGVSSSAAPPRVESATELGQIVAHVSSSRDVRLQSSWSSTGEEKPTKTRRIVIQPGQVLAHVSHSGVVHIETNEGQDAHDPLLTEVPGLDDAEFHGAVEVTNKADNIVRGTPDMNDQLAGRSIMHVMHVSSNAVMLSALAFGVCYVLMQLAYTRSATVFSQVMSATLKALVILACCLLVVVVMVHRFDSFKTAFPIAVVVIVSTLGWSYHRGLMGPDLAPSLDLYPIILMLIYVGLFVTYSFTTNAIKGIGPAPTVLVLVSFVTRCICSMTLWMVQDGSFTDFLVTARKSQGLLIKYSVVAVLYALSDLLRMTFVQEAGPSAFHVLVNFRVLVLVVAWEVVLGMRLRGCHWAAVGAICLGCFVKEVAHSIQAGGLESLPLTAYLHIFYLFVLTTCGAVYNEKMLKGQDAPPMNLQNTALYAFGFAFMLLQSIGTCVFYGVAQAPAFQLKEYALFGHPMVLFQSLVFTTLGLMTSVILKQLTTVHKEVCNGIEVLVTVPLDAAVFGAQFSFLEVSGCATVFFGVCVFALFPITKGTAPVPNMTEPKAETDSIITKLPAAGWKGGGTPLPNPKLCEAAAPDGKKTVC